MTVHPSNDRFFDVKQSEDEALGVRRLAGELVRVFKNMFHAVDIASGGEGTTCSGEHDDVGIRVRACEPQCLDHLHVHHSSKGVEDLRPVHGDGQQPVAPFQKQHFEAGQIAHCQLQRRSAARFRFSDPPPSDDLSSLTR